MTHRTVGDRRSLSQVCAIGVVLAVVLTAYPRPAHAQTGTAGMQGSVVDAQRGVLPGATVTITNLGTSAPRETITSANGGYQFLGVPPGDYRVEVTLAGFQTTRVERITLQVDSTARLNLTLELGALTETVNVQGTATVLNTVDSSLGNVVGGTQIRELPLEGRNVVGLLSLQAGVTFVPKVDPDTTDPRFGSVSGARADQSNVTLDGIDVNDQQNQSAFTSALRVTLDSVQEFRVTTSSYGADQGRSSGAQVSLVTRSGTNTFDGAGYWVNRDTRFSSNEHFLELSQRAAGQESQPPILNKNIFGGSIGGPVKRDRLFFFGNVEALNEQRETSVVRNAPSATLRDGVIVYRCTTPAECPGGAVRGIANTHTVPAGSYGLSPAELRRIDPLGLGPNPVTLQHFNRYPLPNESGNFPGNVDGYRFAAPLDNQFRTYIGRLDYKATTRQSLFARWNVQRDGVVSSPSFPGQPASTTRQLRNRGIALGYDWVLGPSAVNTLRYGYSLIDDSTDGRLQGTRVTFEALTDFDGTTSSNSRKLGTYNLVNDFSTVKGRHTLKAGANVRWVRNDTATNASSYSRAQTSVGWTAGSGRRYMPGGACPAPADCSGLPAVATGSQSAYGTSLTSVLGVLSRSFGNYNYGIDGTLLPAGQDVQRRYAADEYEGYVQDSWAISSALTVTGGLRYGLYSPPYEVNGLQVAPSVSLGDWFDERARLAAGGQPTNLLPYISYVPAGPKNDRRGLYDWDKNNVAPRVAFAWSVDPKTVVRGGYSLVYDRVGAGIATTFDAGGSIGLSTSIQNAAGAASETIPSSRLTGLEALPPSVPAAPPGAFPSTPGFGQGGLATGIDDRLQTPYAHVFNLVVGRDLWGSLGVEAAYVGRRGRNELVRRDLAMPANLVDSRSGADYFTASRQLIDALNGPGGSRNVAAIPYWENLFPAAAGGGLTATQAIAQFYSGFPNDWVSALQIMDRTCRPACSVFGPAAYFTPQYDFMNALSSIGRSNYDALQLSLRKRFSRGHQFDVNYTLSQAEDLGSGVERGGGAVGFGGGAGSGTIINAWEPERNFGSADFDVRHQINVNGLAELPFGRGRALAGNAGPLLDGLIGGWAVSGILRWTSGFPFNVANCTGCWATNWNLGGNAELLDPSRLPATEAGSVTTAGRPSPFANAADALSYFRKQYPGETGVRNLLRGDGSYGIDLGLSKSVAMPFGHRVQIRWEVFNLTNAVRFDTATLLNSPDAPASFGTYRGTLATCDGAAGRCMQLNVRYQF